ncbi:hypothetical protein LTR36_009206 [Oleoguttula mirabilis]|uniref:Uncharacterized protein n=1 Tax=Oleoguttula mirabilis TaxID=1507867 RepID=A0AAV9J6W8_9PEZI|nr:hypothetical protein LTR36_009206 [Oleoguttula mirabilis]
MFVSCLCHGFYGDFGLPEATVTAVGLDEPDYSKFENWIPRFIRPERSCDYCHSKRLNCYLRRGEAHCIPCLSLFRQCSLTASRDLEAFTYAEGSSNFLDTLHVVDEDACKDQGTLTGVKPLASKGRGNGTSTPVRDDAPGSSKRNGIRFPRHAVKILRDWLDAHADHPYPSEEEKASLEERTELKSSQIANWLANARRRRKVTEKFRPKLCRSPSLRPTTPAITIPGPPEKPWDELNPLERWKHSPPEHDPASITDIAHAVAHSGIAEDQVSRSPSSGRRKHSSNGSGFSSFRAPSTTSLDTSGRTSSISSTALSRGSSHSHGSFGSFSSGLAGKKDRKRRRRPTAATAGLGGKAVDDKKRIFQCTFCTDTFKSKFDWARHEKSLHLSLEKWICAPLGPIVAHPATITGNKKCVYCDAVDPSDDHLESHNHRQCEDKGLDARTFYRKDHLRQHLRLMHGCELASSMDNWKSTAVNINSRCGFCTQRFTVWQERVDHLTAHFKVGVRMSEWKGCRGLDPAVAAQVTNAMPPYLIGIESVSPNPFSAANPSTLHGRDLAGSVTSLEEFTSGGLGGRPSEGGGSGYNAKTTCWEILTVRLGKYAHHMAKKGIVLSDEMLQQQARRILYASDDSWNQTAADNPEWLDLFKKAHGLDYIPTAVGGQGNAVPEDLETYGDLGLRIPFAVRLQAYNQSHGTEYTRDHVSDAYRTTPETRQAVVENKDPRKCNNTARGLETLSKLHSGACGPDSHALQGQDDQLMAAARARGLAALVRLDIPITDCDCDAPKSASRGTHVKSHKLYSSEAQDEQLVAAARARGLASLAGMEGPVTGDCDAPKSASGKAHLRRHKLELPADRAQRFETTTPAWQDAGMMPPPMPTATLGLGYGTTSTGAMMEFLGGDVGRNLPFSNDAATSRIALPPTVAQAFDWNFDLAAPVDDAEMLKDLDDLIAATSTAPSGSTAASGEAVAPLLMDTAWMTGAAEALQPATSTITTYADFPNDLVMEDFDFDDMTFGGVFDMPMHDTFGVGADESITYCSPGTHSTGPPDLRFLHYNDVYHLSPGSQEPVGGIARFKTLCSYYQNNERFAGQPACLTFFSGDAFNPSLESSVTKGKHMVPALNAIGTTVACLGNHDLDFGVEQFEGLAALCAFPWLCANVLDPALGDTVPLGHCKRTVMLTASNGIKIGVIGLVEREWLDTINTLPPDLVFVEPAVVARELAPRLRAEGAEMVVALTHQRQPNDERLARELEAGMVDVVLCGHDHYYAHSVVNGTQILRSGTDFRQLSYLECRRRRGKGGGAWDFHITRRDILSSIAEDAHAVEMVDKITSSLRPKLEKAIGYTAAPLDARFTTVRRQESNLGNFVCDLMRFHYDADCCIMAAGTIRGDQVYPPGVLKVGDVMDCFPFEDPCVVVGVTGRAVVEALENAVSKYPALEGRFPQVSGIRFCFDPAKAPGHRCSDVMVGGGAVELTREYRLVTRDYMVRGKDGFTSLMLEECGGRARSIVADENGMLISMILRQYFMSLKILGRWKKWGPGMAQHWGGVHEGLHDVHPVREPVVPGESGRRVEDAKQARDDDDDDDDEGREVPGLVGKAQRQDGHRIKEAGDEETHLLEYSDSEDEESHRADLPAVGTRHTRRERELVIMRKVMRKWWRLAGLAGHPSMCEEVGEEFGVHWTKGICPRVEGRIRMVGAAG